MTAPPGPATTGDNVTPPEALMLQLQGLQHAVASSRRSVRMLSLATWVLAGLLALWLISSHFSAVFEYAELSQLQVFPSDDRPGSVTVRYVPQSPGKIEFTRISPSRTETLVQHVPDLSSRTATASNNDDQFEWTGEPQPGTKIRVLHRTGWRLTTMETVVTP